MKTVNKILGKLGIFLFVLVSLHLTSSVASATIFEYFDDKGAVSNDAGNFGDVSFKYDDINQILTWDISFTDNNGVLPNGFFFVLSDGVEPKKDYKEYAIFYGDTITNKVSVYVYDADDGQSSWMGLAEHIKSFDNLVESSSSGPGELTLGFTLDIALINGYVPLLDPNYTIDWDGASFDEDFGIWYHALVLDEVEYDNDWKLSKFKISEQSSYDRFGRTTAHVVPEPASMALFGLGMGAFGYIRRKRK